MCESGSECVRVCVGRNIGEKVCVRVFVCECVFVRVVCKHMCVLRVDVGVFESVCVCVCVGM